MALCPPNSTLPTYALCFMVQELCDVAELADTGEPVHLSVRLNRPPGMTHIQDPTTGGVVNAGYVFTATEASDGDGCMVTCPLPANQSSEEGLALVPAGTSYHVQLTRGRTLIALWPEFVLDNEAAAGATTNSVDTTTCVPFLSLLPPPATVPPSDAFEAAVLAVLDDNGFTPGGGGGGGGGDAGSVTFTVIASEDITAGQAVNIFPNSGIAKARKADSSLARPATGFAGATVTSGSSLTVIDSGTVSGLTGLTPAADYWLGDAGALVPNGGRTTTIGEIDQYVGFALSATALRTRIDPPSEIA